MIYFPEIDTSIPIETPGLSKRGESHRFHANRVGRGIAPPPSHTTVHAFAHGGFLKLFNLL